MGSQFYGAASARFPEAPVDGNTYGRQNAAWVEVTGGGAIDWDNYLFALNEDLSGLTNAFGKAVNSPATLVIDNTGTPITITE